MQNLSIFTWNIANPSPERAAKQAEWIRKRKEDIFVLTEIKTSRGCLFLKKYFENRKTTRKLSITPLSSTCSAGLSLPRRSAPLFHRQVICPSPRCPPLLASSTERCFACRAA